MRFAECLNQSDIKNLRKIAERHTIACTMYSKNSLFQEIMGRFSEPNYVVDRLSAISQTEYNALLEIALDGREEYTREDLLAILKRAQPVTSSEQTMNATEDLLRVLIEEGFIFESGVSSRKVFACPIDIWKKVRAFSSSRLRQEVQAASHAPTIYQSDEAAMARDAVTCLLFFSRQEIRLTQEGVIFKRQQQQLFQILSVSEEPLPPSIGWRFGFGRRFHDYPDRFALIYDHLYEENCIEETPDLRLTVHQDQAERYMRLSEDERALKLFQYWMRAYRKAIPNIRRLVARLAELTAHDWVYADSVQSAIIPQVSSYFYEDRSVILDSRILRMLAHLGVMMVGSIKIGGPDAREVLLYRLSPLGSLWLRKDEVRFDAPHDSTHEDTAATIQPTFEILVPPTGDAVYGWDLQIIADLKSNDQMRCYEITRSSIYRALQADWNQARIMSFLQTISNYPVPGNVEKMIESWCKDFGRVEVSVLCVLSCADEKTAQEIRLIAPLMARAKIDIEHAAIGFAADDEEFVVSILQRLGYLVKTRSAKTR